MTPSPRPPRRLLVVDDDAGQRQLLAGYLAPLGHEVLTAGSGAEAVAVLDRGPVDLLISDVRMPGISGLALLRLARARLPQLPVILVSAYADVRDAVNAMRDGALNYLAKPIDLDELRALASAALGEAPAAGAADPGPPVAVPPHLVADSPAMRDVLREAALVAPFDSRVLLTGESGTGKEVVARAIHHGSPREKRPFVALNCGAIPSELLESELFGHVRGAFTGADRDRRGVFREASGGSLLLDEIGEMPSKMQAGLLRVLQERLVRPVGAAREEAVDTRVLAATHRDLSAMVAAGKFREDLYYRLNVIQVRVPPLRERIEDVPLLIDHFLGLFAARYGRERRSVGRAALRRLMAFGWPGNVRQLENALLNAWVLSDRPVLEADDFELGSPTAPGPPSSSRGRATSLGEHKALERERLLAALEECRWNRVRAASLLGVPRRTFYRRLEEFGLLERRGQEAEPSSGAGRPKR